MVIRPARPFSFGLARSQRLRFEALFVVENQQVLSYQCCWQQEQAEGHVGRVAPVSRISSKVARFNQGNRGAGRCRGFGSSISAK
jgi:hypothetical protein